MINPVTVFLLIILFVFLIVLYALCVKCCCDYFDDKKIDQNIITILIVLVPILNFIIALKAVNWKNIKKIFKSEE